MPDQAKATLHIPLDLDPENNNTGERIIVPENIRGWMKRLMKETQETETLYLSISSLTDAPGTFDIIFQAYPLPGEFDDLEENKVFGLSVDRDFIRTLYDALGYLLGEERRGDPEGTFGSHQ